MVDSLRFSSVLFSSPRFPPRLVVFVLEPLRGSFVTSRIYYYSYRKAAGRKTDVELVLNLSEDLQGSGLSLVSWAVGCQGSGD